MLVNPIFIISVLIFHDVWNHPTTRYRLSDFDKVSKINFDYMFSIYLNRLISILIVIQLLQCAYKCAFFIITDNGTSEHYTELGEVGKSNTYNKIGSYAN